MMYTELGVHHIPDNVEGRFGSTFVDLSCIDSNGNSVEIAGILSAESNGDTYPNIDADMLLRFSRLRDEAAGSLIGM